MKRKITVFLSIFILAFGMLPGMPGASSSVWASDSSLDLEWTPASGEDGTISGEIGNIVTGDAGILAAITGSGDNRKLIVSQDSGRSWSACDTGTFIPRDVVFDGSVFISAGNGIMTSADGVLWTAPTVGGSPIDWSNHVMNALTTAATSKGVVTVACGSDGLILVSDPSGEDTYSTWYKLYNPAPGVTFIHRFSYVPSHSSGGYNVSEGFVGYGSSSAGNIYTITATMSNPTFLSVSTAGDSINTPYFTNVWYENAPELFYAIKPHSPSGEELWMTTANLYVWSLAETYSNAIRGSASGGGATVLIGSDGMIYTSEDGDAWTSQQITSEGLHPDLNEITYAGEIFVAVGDHGVILTSEDGQVWNLCSSGTSSDLTGIAYDGRDFIVGGEDLILYSGSAGPSYVCQMGPTKYTDLGDALNAVGTGQTATIKLLKDVDYYEGISISNGSSITFDLNGFDLNVFNSSSTGLTVTSGSVGYTGQGEFNVNGNSFGVSVNKDPAAVVASAVVTNVTSFNAGYGAYSMNGGSITIQGNVTGGAAGVWAFTSGSSITVLGDVAAGASEGAGACASANGKVTVEGGITANQYVQINGETLDGTGSSRTVPTTKSGYYTYSTGGSISTVWVKVPPTDVWPEGSELAAGGTTHNSTVLSWSAAAEAEDYTIYKDDLLDGGSDGALTYTVGGLSPSTEYSFRVDAYRPDTGWIAGPSATVKTGAAPVEGGGTGGGSGGGGGLSQTYTADIKYDSGATKSLPIILDQDGRNAAVDLSAEKPLEAGASVITVPGIPGVTAYTLAIPASYLSDPDRKGEITVDTALGSIALPPNMLAGIPDTEGKKAEITIGQGDRAKLTGEELAAAENRPLIQLTLTLNGTKTDWSNPHAPVTVSIPYSPKGAELANTDSLIIWYLDGSGRPVCVPNGHYDSKTGTVTFTATHFSQYAAGFNPLTFLDVKNSAWYAKAVSFLSAREITTGTGGGNFSPAEKLTRAQFLVMVMKAYELAPDTNPTDNFADGGGAYYTDYLASAKRLGLAEGVGNNLFAPNKEITRQEMFTLLYKVLKELGQLPEGTAGKPLSAFGDSGEIPSWAREAMSLLAESGTIVGSGGKLLPGAPVTRAELAQTVYNLLSN